MDKKLITIVVLLIAVAILSFVIYLNDTQAQYKSDLDSAYMQGRYDTLEAISIQLQQKGTVTLTVPVFDVETNTTLFYNIEIGLIE